MASLFQRCHISTELFNFLDASEYEEVSGAISPFGYFVKQFLAQGDPGDPGGGSAQPDIQIFTASGTWTKPDNAVSVTAHCIGAGGGASGRCGSSGSTRGGGGGGGGGGYSTATFDAGDLSATESVTVGGGAVGTIVGDNTNGNAGGAGGTGTTANGTAGAQGGVGGSVIPVGADAAGNSNHMAGGEQIKQPDCSSSDLPNCGCEPGSKRDEDGVCQPIKDEFDVGAPCSPGYKRDPVSRLCVPDPSNCPPGFHLNPYGVCTPGSG